ncbi:MAG: hypothetical protein J6A01_12810 [Proteobacteria bacterium]|nr:hypothetical protein [Pseudomonadota bacterium]
MTLGAVFAGVGIVIGILFYLLFFAELKKYKNKKDYQCHFLPSGQKMFETLFTHGTKSIATVVSCEYCPSSSSSMEPYYLTKMEEDPYVNINGRHPMMPKDDSITAYYHLRPAFKLIYKFNPPDDNNPEDLYHTIMVHSDFSETLKEGDPLPILYYINPKDNLDVMSMPFPYPLHDFLSYQDMIHCKRANDECGKQLPPEV